MDIPRESAIRKRRIRRLIYLVVGLLAIGSVSLGLSRLKPAAPSVDKATVWVDTVKRGPMLLQVRGLGSLVPEEILWIPATTDGRVVRRFILAGTLVKADTVIMELANPEQEQATLDAEWQLKAAEAQHKSLKAQLDSQLLDQKAAAATVQSDYTEANLNAEKDAELAKLGLGAELNAKVTRAKSEALATRNEIEKQRLAVSAASVKAQLDAQQARVEQLRALYELKKAQLDSLRVRAGADGVLQELSVEVGQRVTAGTILAKVVQPAKLKAQLKIPETQAKDVQIGQSASIDTRNGVIPGHVMRVDPAVQNGTVTVDVKLDGPLPKGARPDLSVEGTIELENLADVVYVGRPAFGQPNSTVGIFKLDEDGKGASRVQVKLGRASVNSVEILGGLQPGDKVVLSDMSAWDAFNRVRLE
ncbi:MAG: efflux RND transporter periplasmic adaptor subunit [Acidobacteriia bacterium]|nr:efflux RND transporter periplasmic adaptor subunit [Terriglobia bacterium]